ncbi:hypothetical protein NC652_023075 [Populus alba x Populus x berolinensis]|nr:hypothetical protein NC652_023075 [Populus alba x Populus x berolinensis]
MQPVPVLDNGVQKQPGKPLFFCHPAILDGQLLHFHLNSFRRCTTNLIWSLFGIFEFLMFPFFMFFKWDRLDSVLNSCTIEALRYFAFLSCLTVVWCGVGEDASISNGFNIIPWSSKASFHGAQKPEKTSTVSKFKENSGCSISKGGCCKPTPTLY